MLLVGCNEVYSLDATKARDAFEPFDDFDRDGIADDRDNCQTVPNHDQSDVDGDRAGDACDGCTACMPCTLGPNHDEDGDKLADSCDNCPAVANPDQANGDGDDLGTACDPDDTMIIHRRRFFDGFAELSPDWLQGGAPWTIAADAVTPSPGLPGGIYVLRHRTLEITPGTTWFVEVGIEPEKPGYGGYYLGSTGQQLSCLVEPITAQTWRINNSGFVDQMQFPIDRPLRLRYSLKGATMTCEVVGVHAIDAGPFTGLTYPIHIDLTTVSRAKYTYVDVIAP